MRTPTAQEAKVQAAPHGYQTRARVRVLLGATWHDLTALAGHDWLESVEYGETLDESVGSATVSVRRDVDLLSLAPFRTDSKLNLLGGGYDPLIREGREFVVETATLPLGIAPGAGDWREVFRGDVDEVDAGGEVLVFRGRDLGGRMQRRFIETEATYSVPSGTAVETVMGSILADNGFASGDLYTPVSPSWAIGPYAQQREPVLDALRALAQQIGWDVRYKWRASASAFALTLYEPARTKTAPDAELAAGTYRELRRVATNLVNVRNAVEVVYSDPADLDTAAQPKRKTVSVSDATSITKYGRLWMQIAEGDTSNINTGTEATRLANAALADLKEPLLEQEVETDYLYQVELGDLIRLKGNGVHYTADQDAAVISVQHALSGGEARTTLTLRGKPSLGPKHWLRLDARPSIGGESSPFVGPSEPTSVLATATSGGVAVKFSPPTTGPDWDAFELHVSTTSGFTPSAATLKATGSVDRFEVSGLAPGVAHYASVVPRDAAGNRGTPSAQATFTPTYVGPGLMQPAVDFGDLPPNRSFEAQTAPAAPPDTWTASLGTWGTNLDLSTSFVLSGSRALRLFLGSAALRSQNINVTPGASYVLETWAAASILVSGFGDRAVYITIEYLDSAGAFISDATSYLSNGVIDTWKAMHAILVAPSTARFARVLVGKRWVSSNDFTAYFDAVRFARWDAPRPLWVTPTLVNNFTNAGGNLQTVGYTKNNHGAVELRGSIRRAFNDYVPAFTLPAGYRPVAQRRFACVVQGSPAQTGVDVYSGGEVSPFGYSANGEISLDGISFTTD